MSKGMNLWDAMVEMYERYGYYKDEVQSLSFSGIAGQETMKKIMAGLRADIPSEIGGLKVLSVRDYQNDTILDTASGQVRPTGLPRSNVLYFDLDEKAWVCVRPSGTEPKIKFYYGVRGTSMEDADRRSAELGKAVLALAE